MKIAYIGDFINHGKSLVTAGTSIVILLSLLESVDSIDVYSSEENQKIEEFELPSKVRLFQVYKYDNFPSVLRLLSISWCNYDEVIFNLIPTGFGNASLSNAIGLFIPIVLVKLRRLRNIKVIYHNSVFTNNVRTLGYNSKFDKFRLFFLKIVERLLFKNVKTFVLLNLYKHKIDNVLGKNKVQLFRPRYLEAVTTLYINNLIDAKLLDIPKTDIPIVLMHGYWGPQKNLELGLSALRSLKESGINFKLVISGGINHHFIAYGKKFQQLLYAYSDIIDEYIGAVTEKEVMKIFLGTDILVLPYNTPGGRSGVLEQAMFFEVPTISIEFPEYVEQGSSACNIMLTSKDNFCSSLISLFGSFHKNDSISVYDKILIAKESIRTLLK